MKACRYTIYIDIVNVTVNWRRGGRGGGGGGGGEGDYSLMKLQFACR